MANLPKNEKIISEVPTVVAPKPLVIGHDFILPGGIKQGSRVIRDIVMDEMTGIDEENVSSPAVANNGGKAMTVLLAGVVKKIGDAPVTQDIIRGMLIGDRDFLLLKLRMITLGNNYETTITCPSCSAKFSIVVNLEELEIKKLEDDEGTSFPFVLAKGYKDANGVVHKEGVISLPTGVEQEYLAGEGPRNPGVATTQLLTRCCRKLGTLEAVTTAIIRVLSSKDREIMARLMRDKMPGPVMEVTTSCPTCSHKWTSPLSVADFFVSTPQS